jgi:hypothetical protein
MKIFEGIYRLNNEQQCGLPISAIPVLFGSKDLLGPA